MLIAVLVAVAVILAAITVAAVYLARSWCHRRATVATIRPEITPAAPCEKEDGGNEDDVGVARDRATAIVDASNVGDRPGEVIGSRDADTKEAAGCNYGPFEMETQEQLTRYTFDNFVVGTGNRSAYRLARAAAESPGLRFNPLFIYGGPGLGKTHLMCALASDVYERDSDTNVRYLTSQAFAEQILDAYRSREVERFEREYIQTDVLLIDDIQLLAMSQSLQSVVARILGEIYEQGKQIVVSSDRRPQDLRGLAQEITARFSTGVIIEVDRPDAALRTKILRRRARLEDWPVEDELLVYVAHSLDGDIRTLEGVAMKLVALKNLQGTRLDKAVVDGLLKEVADDNEQSTRPPEGGRALPVGFEFSPGTALNREPADAAAESAPREEGVAEREFVAPRRVNPLVQEFSRAAPLARKLATPSEVASAVPQAVSTYVIVLGTSSHLVTNTVEAMVGRGNHHVQFSEGAPWAYMVHLECEDPHWVLVGTTHWDREADLARTVTSHEPPAFVVVLDGENPEIANAKELISSVTGDGGMAVVVLGSFLPDSSGALRKMLRLLLGVPLRFPVLVQGEVDTPGSRTWVKLALGSRRTAARSEGSDEPAVSSG